MAVRNVIGVTHNSANNGFQYSIRAMLIAIVMIACVLWVVRFAYRLADTPKEAYAMWDGGCLIIDHLRVNQQWPKNWDDLSATLAKGGGRTRFGFTIDDLRKRLIVDFAADPDVLRQAAFDDVAAPFHVICLRSGRDTYWTQAEPNTLIYRYLTGPSELLRNGHYHSQIQIP